MASLASSTSSTFSGERPAFIYGTAWKKNQTKRLVKEAILAGFRHVDTAAQPRHYQEHLVGEALREAYSDSLIKREDIYVQTKYTTPAGQDLSDRPYNPDASLDDQIKASVTSSLKNLRRSDETDEISYIDCLLLHSPLPTIEKTLQAWKLLEAYVPLQIRMLGISNVTLPILQAIHESSTVKPSVVQSRFYAQTRYDIPLRAFCKEHHIMYQSFWTLTGNPALLKSEPVVALAEATGVGRPVALYALVMGLGVVVLNGTTSKQHMCDDLEAVMRLRDWAINQAPEWANMTNEFRTLITDNRH
ncbi:aldo-keto reductase-like protein [Phaeosphaeriaceae sp. PMI808]|nr:aldo-keto reductase-like protein [Phaeosphaeriaceae sp. PMI808]